MAHEAYELSELEKRFRLPARIPYGRHGVQWGSRVCPPDVLDRLPELNLTDEDVVVATYPKAGTTWMTEIVSLIYLDGQVDKAREKNITDRVIFLEYKNPVKGGVCEMDALRQMEPPRQLKTHISSSLYEKHLSRGTKFVIVMRNPKDNLVSFYHFHKTNPGLGGFPGGSWHDFFNVYMNHGHVSGDMLDWNLSWWKQRHLPNVLLVSFEDMKRDPRETVTKVSAFCGKGLDDDVIDRITKATTFDVMKDNPTTNYTEWVGTTMDQPFMRKGQVGDWKNYFTVAENEEFDRYIQDKVGDSGLTFQYDM